MLVYAVARLGGVGDYYSVQGAWGLGVENIRQNLSQMSAVHSLI